MVRDLAVVTDTHGAALSTPREINLAINSLIFLYPGRNPGFSFAEDTDDLFVGKTLLHGDVLMWLMKTLLTSGCINQRGAGQRE